MDNFKILTILSVIGGFYEIFFGIMMLFFISPLLSLLGLEAINIEMPIFHQTAGFLAIFLGLMLTLSTLKIEKYIMNILLVVYLRLTIQIIILTNIVILIEIAVGLFLFGLIDLIFALITIYLLKKLNISLNIFKNI